MGALPSTDTALAVLRRGAATLGILLGPAVLAVGAAPARAEDAGFQVIVNPANAASSVTREYVSRLFLKKIVRWEDETSVAPVDLPESDPVREAFSRFVHGRPARAIKAYWQRMIFSGRASPPPEAAWEAEVLAFVADHSGGIGYVSPGAPLEGVKVLEVTDR